MIWPLLANRWLLGGLVAAVVAAGTVWTAYNAGYEAGATRVQTAWDAERLEALRARAEFETAARKREQELAARAAQQRQDGSPAQAGIDPSFCLSLIHI